MSRNDKHERLIETARTIMISISIMQSLILHMTVYPYRYSAPVTIKKYRTPDDIFINTTKYYVSACRVDFIARSRYSA